MPQVVSQTSVSPGAAGAGFTLWREKDVTAFAGGGGLRIIPELEAFSTQSSKEQAVRFYSILNRLIKNELGGDRSALYTSSFQDLLLTDPGMTQTYTWSQLLRKSMSAEARATAFEHPEIIGMSGDLPYRLEAPAEYLRYVVEATSTPAEWREMLKNPALRDRFKEDCCSIHVASLADFDISASPQIRRFQLERIFGEITTNYFDGNKREFTAFNLSALLLATPEENPDYVRADDLLVRYAEAIRDIEVEERIDPRLAKTETLSAEEAAKYFRREGSRRSLLTKEMSALYAAFEYDPAGMEEAATFLRGRAAAGCSVENFTAVYSGLQGCAPSGSGTRGGSSDKFDSISFRKLYIEAIVRGVYERRELDFSEANLHRQKVLLLRMLRLPFEKDPEGVIREVEQGAAKLEGYFLDSFSSRAREFLERLHSEVALSLQQTLAFKMPPMRMTAYQYQTEGSRFLVEGKRAILGDETGLAKTYQAVAAAESLGFKKIIWITTATNLEGAREEILKDSFVGDEEVSTVRRQGFAGLSGPNDKTRYFVVSFSMLAALYDNDRTRYNQLVGGADAVVVDEAQLIDNPAALRSRAVRNIQTEYAWLLSASPYQNRVANLWTLLNYIRPEEFPSRRDFKETHLSSYEAITAFRSRLDRVMLRRTKLQTLKTFDDPETIPFSEQIKDGVPRMPALDRVAWEKDIGRYALSEEQSRTIAWIISDFEGWINNFNKSRPKGEAAISVRSANALLKFNLINRAIFEPERLGLAPSDAHLEAVKRLVLPKLQRGERVVVWGFNNSTIEKIFSDPALAAYGVRKITGKSSDDDRNSARKDFQEKKRVQLLVANYTCAGLGLTLSAADAAVFAQIPETHSRMIQTEGRTQRLIGLGQLMHAKKSVAVHYVVPQFGDEFIETVKDAVLARILRNGTIVEQTLKRLRKSELLFNMVMGGLPEPGNIEARTRAEILEACGLRTRLPLAA